MKIICGTDFSVHSDEMAMSAAALAARLKGTLVLVHVLDQGRYVKPTEDFIDHLRANRQKQLEVVAHRARRRGAIVEAKVVVGSPAAKLTELASSTNARLLVLGSSGQIGANRWLAGSVTDQTAQASSVPTLVMRNARAFQTCVHGKRPLNVFVGYDFSEGSDAALRWAAALSNVMPCEITVGYVASPINERMPLGTIPPMSPLYYPPGLRQFLESKLRQRADAITGGDKARTCLMADCGRADSQLIGMAAESGADLMVVATSKRRGLARLRSVSRGVFHYSHMGVVCVPPSRQSRPAVAALQFERVLIPIDASTSGAQAIAKAYAAARNGGEVCFAHVVPPSRSNAKACSLLDEDCGLSAGLEALIPESARERGVETWREVVEHHEPAAGICRAAERFNADLVCMESRGGSRFKESILGSVSQEVMRRSNRPVLVVPGASRAGSSLATRAGGFVQKAGSAANRG